MIDIYSIKPIDKDAIIKAAKETRAILTVEDHNVIGGMGGAVAEVLCEYAPAKLRRMGLQDKFGRSGNADKLYEIYHLTSEDIAQACREIIK